MAKIWAIDPYHRSKRSRDARNGWAHRHVSVVELSTKTGSGRYLDLNYPECVNGNLMLAVVRAIANRQLACVEKPTILPWIFAAISHKIPDRSSQREQIEMLDPIALFVEQRADTMLALTAHSLQLFFIEDPLCWQPSDRNPSIPGMPDELSFEPD